MKNEEWLIVDTETNGLYPPIYTLEIAAQRMIGWEPAGEPFRVLLNHDVPIDPAAEAVHGYSREFLRDAGEEPGLAHEAFHAYARDLPLVAYNVSFDWDRVLLPEYRRLRVPVSGTKGFCAMTLARRVIHETGNHRLETLKNHFRLSEGPSHRGLNDVMSVVALFRGIFRERLETSGIVGFESVARFSRKTPVAGCLAQLRNALDPDCQPAVAPPPKPRKTARPEGEPSFRRLTYPQVKAFSDEVLRRCERLLAEELAEEAHVRALRKKLQSCPFPRLYPMCALAEKLESYGAAGSGPGPERDALLDTIREAVDSRTDSQE
jgi:DNA polymerase III epsilon subunit-like protein